MTFRLFLIHTLVPSVCCAALAKILRLDENKIGDIGAEKLAVALSNLKNLEVTWLEPLSLVTGPLCATMLRAHIAIAE